MLRSFHVPIGHLYVFFEKMSVQIVCPFLIKLFGVLTIELYEFFIFTFNIFNVNLLSDILFADIFSHSESCLFILLIRSFAVLKLFSLT